MSEREEHFEQMLVFIQDSLKETEAKLDALRGEGKMKTVSFRELLSNRVVYERMLDLCRQFGLV